ncbi:MAG: DUF882 domain-containing protein [Xanthobacteraceae bacterium]|nr:DUF882 domain-containing protein [Xanthobacteraceae bacterium]
MDRRLFLSLIAGTVAIPGLAKAVPEAAPSSLTLRRLSLINPHTGETFDGAYRDDDGPIPEVMDELSIFLRDFHSGEKIAIDIGVLDFLASVMDSVGQTRATILSAYRTAETNAALSKTTFGVAENSQHIFGRALDVHFGEKLSDAMQAARAMQRGGVGWYPQSSFMHIDSGPVRNWTMEHRGLGTLLVGNRRIQFNAKGEMLVANGKKLLVGGKPVVLRGTPTTTAAHNAAISAHNAAVNTMRARLVRLQQIARAAFSARKI